MKANRFVAVASALACVVVSGCAMDVAPTANGGAENVGQSKEALSGLLVFSWGGVGSSGAWEGSYFTSGSSVYLDLGVSTGWTCWMRGVQGNLGNSGEILVGQNYQYIQGVKETNWYLKVNPAPGAALNGSAVCAPTGQSYQTMMSPAGTIGKPGQVRQMTLLSYTNNINTFCGLSAMGPSASYEWAGATSFATISNNGTNPNSIPGNPTWTWTEENAEAEATCADAGIHYMYDWDIVAPTSGTVTMPLGTMPAWSTCFLSSITGSFQSNSFTDGVSVNVNSSGQWSMTASNGKKATATCVY